MTLQYSRKTFNPIHSKRTAQSVLTCGVQPSNGELLPVSAARAPTFRIVYGTASTATYFFCKDIGKPNIPIAPAEIRCWECPQPMSWDHWEIWVFSGTSRAKLCWLAPSACISEGKGTEGRAHHMGGCLNTNPFQEHWQCFDQHIWRGHTVQQAEAHLIRIMESTCF